MSAPFWFLLGFWVGGCAGFFLFACLQVARDAARMSVARDAARMSDVQWSALNHNGRQIKEMDGKRPGRRELFYADEAGC